MDKINRMHVAVVGAIVILVSAALIYFLFVRNLQATAKLAGDYDKKKAAAAQKTTQENATKQAKNDLLLARFNNITFLKKNPKWSVQMSNPVSRYEGLVHQENEITHVMGPMLTRFFLRIRPDLIAIPSGWTLTGPQPTAAATFTQSPIVHPGGSGSGGGGMMGGMGGGYPGMGGGPGGGGGASGGALGTINVIGTYQSVMSYIQSIRNSPRIVTIGAVTFDSSLASATPIPSLVRLIHATITLTAAYEFIPGLPTAAASAAGGGAMGGMGGMGGGGYPGMGGGGYPSSGGGYPSSGG